jgi:hypothetical protein
MMSQYDEVGPDTEPSAPPDLLLPVQRVAEALSRRVLVLDVLPELGRVHWEEHASDTYVREI